MMPVPDPPPAANGGAVGVGERGHLPLFEEQTTHHVNGGATGNGNGHATSNGHAIGNGHAILQHPASAPRHDFSHPPIASKLATNRLLSPLHHSLHLHTSEPPPYPNEVHLPSLKAIPLSSYYKLHRVPSLTKMSEPDSGTDEAQGVKLPRRESTTEAPPPTLPPNGIHNKILEQVVRTPGRLPSPQPTHLSVPGPSQPRLLHEHGSGYVAPKFDGKASQMDHGKPP